MATVIDSEILSISTASAQELNFNEPHSPHKNAVDAFNHVLPTIKAEIIKSRHHWDKHEPKMWRRARGIHDHDLTAFTIEQDLVLVCGTPVMPCLIQLNMFTI